MGGGGTLPLTTGLAASILIMAAVMTQPRSERRAPGSHSRTEGCTARAAAAGAWGSASTAGGPSAHAWGCRGEGRSVGPTNVAMGVARVTGRVGVHVCGAAAVRAWAGGRRGPRWGTHTGARTVTHLSPHPPVARSQPPVLRSLRRRRRRRCQCSPAWRCLWSQRHRACWTQTPGAAAPPTPACGGGSGVACAACRPARLGCALASEGGQQWWRPHRRPRGRAFPAAGGARERWGAWGTRAARPLSASQWSHPPPRRHHRRHQWQDPRRAAARHGAVVHACGAVAEPTAARRRQHWVRHRRHRAVPPPQLQPRRPHPHSPGSLAAQGPRWHSPSPRGSPGLAQNWGWARRRSRPRAGTSGCLACLGRARGGAHQQPESSPARALGPGPPGWVAPRRHRPCLLYCRTLEALVAREAVGVTGTDDCGEGRKGGGGRLGCRCLAKGPKH